VKQSRLGVGAKSEARRSTFSAKPKALERSEMKRAGKAKKRRGPKGGGYAKLVEGESCAWAGLGSLDCGGPIDAHHVIKQQRLEQRFPHGAVWHRRRGEWLPLPKVMAVGDPALEIRDESRTVTINQILRDPRNLLPLCRNHHHAHHGHRRLSVPIDLLPDECREFAVEHGLLGRLERDYPGASS
jgi:hypothetical protein